MVESDQNAVILIKRMILKAFSRHKGTKKQGRGKITHSLPIMAGSILPISGTFIGDLY
jgi:hypothetical protein